MSAVVAVDDYGYANIERRSGFAEERTFDHPLQDLSDCFEAHAAVDGLGGEGEAELVWGDVAGAGVAVSGRDCSVIEISQQNHGR